MQFICFNFSPALYVATYVREGNDKSKANMEKSRILRRNIVRYMVLTQTLIFRDISIQVRKRFPTMETLVATGNSFKKRKKLKSIK